MHGRARRMGRQPHGRQRPPLELGLCPALECLPQLSRIVGEDVDDPARVAHEASGSSMRSGALPTNRTGRVCQEGPMSGANERGKQKPTTFCEVRLWLLEATIGHRLQDRPATLHCGSYTALAYASGRSPILLCMLAYCPRPHRTSRVAAPRGCPRPHFCGPAARTCRLGLLSVGRRGNRSRKRNRDSG